MEILDGRTGLPLLCWRCRKPATSFTNLRASAAGSVPSDMRPVCPDHGGFAGTVTMTPAAPGRPDGAGAGFTAWWERTGLHNPALDDDPSPSALGHHLVKAWCGDAYAAGAAAERGLADALAKAAEDWDDALSVSADGPERDALRAAVTDYRLATVAPEGAP